MKTEYLPDEEETIAAKRAARLSNKLNAAGHRVFYHVWWNNIIWETLAISLIFCLNLLVIYPLLYVPDPGLPFSGPVIPVIAKVIALLGNIPLVFAIQHTKVIFYLLFPIFFYILIKTITGRRLAGLISVLIVSIPVFIFAKPRIILGFFDGDGPHIASLGLMPLALYGLISFLRNGGMKNLTITAVLSSMIALTSPFGFIAYSIFALIIAFSEALLGKGRLKIFRFLLVFLLGGALVSFWYNPSFLLWMASGPLSKDIRQTILNLVPMSLVALPILGTFGFLLFDRRPNLQPLFLASFWTIVFLITVFAGRSNLLPSVYSRYLPELGISMAFLLGIGILFLIDALKTAKIRIIPFLNRPAFSNPLITVVLIVLTGIVIYFRNNSMVGMQEVVEFVVEAKKGQIWISRDSFGGISAIVGYLITTFALGVMLLLWLKTLIERNGFIKIKNPPPLLRKLKQL